MVLFLVAGCNSTIGKKYSVGALTGIPADDAAQAETSSLTAEQQAGYDLGLKNEVKRFHLTQAGEGNLSDDVQSAVRKMVEENEVVALIGATTNDGTRRTASLANFFNVPMIIPGADGDGVMPSNNMWVFRLNAPSSSYAAYVFGNVLSKIKTSGTSDDEAAMMIRLAIVYEENTFGEGAAVATAHAAMDQNIDIVYYGSYTPGAADTAEIRDLAQSVGSSEADLVYIISSDPASAKTLVSALQTAFGSGVKPAMLGQGNGFTSLEFLQAEDIADVYTIRQALDTSNCPAGIDSINKAQAYASAFIIEKAIEGSDGILTGKKLFSRGDQMMARREKVRDVLKEMNIDVPCIGKVSFDNSGQNKEFQFEIFQVENGKLNLVNEEGFRTIIGEIAGRDELIITD